MYKLIKLIENIQNVYTSLDNYIFVDKNDNFYLNGIKESSYMSMYFVLGGHILKQNTENKSFLYLNDTLIKDINHSYIFNTYSENGCFYYENLHYDPKDDKVKKDIYYHDFNDNSIRLFAKGFSENFQLVLDNNTITFQPRTILKSLSLLTGEYEWEVDLSEYGEIRSVLAAVQDNLWVLANDYKNNRHSLLRLDANSGRLMQVLGEDLKLSDAHVKYIKEKQTLLSFKSSISTIPSPSTLVEIDAKTGDVLRNVTVESMLEPNLKVGLWQYQDNQLFFTANTTMMTTTHIGVLDYNTLALLWYIEVPGRKGLLKDIQVSTGKIYVLDQVGTLHIFEKESD